MNEEKAIKLLQERISKLDEANFTPIVWIDETNLLLKKLFSKEDSESLINSINELEFDTGLPFAGEALSAKYTKKGKDEARQYMQGFITHINNGVITVNINGNGNEIPPEKKCLISNWAFIGIILIIIGAAFTFGMYIGKDKHDMEKNNLYKQNQQLELKNDSLKKIIQLNDTTSL
jgi:hypothetical protein